jgi:phage-related protein
VEIFKLFGSIFIDNDEANRSIAKTEEKAEGLGSKLGKGIKTAAKWGTAIAAGAAAATTAVAGLASVAVSSYADYEQLVGGVETLFKDSAGLVQEYAKNAYKTAGMTANQYMETVTSFSASLLQGLNGDTAEAAKVADMAITDMADNANKMGTSLSSIQNAYQGFAKQNYTMLDNLKLGYGGTKAEMERLLADAEKLSGQKYDISNLNDVYEAIHVIQTEMGITGTTAKEATGTISGSINMIKAKFEDFKVSIGEAVAPVVQSFLSLVIDNLPTIEGMIGQVIPVISNLMSTILPPVMELSSSLLPVLVELFNSLIPVFGDITAAMIPLIVTFAEMAQSILPPLIELFSQVVSDILPSVITLFTDILQAVLPPLIELFSGIITTVLPPLMDLLTIIIEDILPPFIDLFNNVISAILPPLMELFSQIIDTLLPPLIELFSQIIDAIMPVLIELFNTFVEVVLPPLMELIDEIVAVILPPLLTLFNELAEIVLPLVMTVFEAMLPVIEPVMNMIAAVIKTVLALIKGDWEGAWNGIKDFFGSFLDYITKLVDGWKKIFVGIFESIGRLISNVWDNIVTGIKNAINFIIKGINFFIAGLNKIKIPDWVPGVGGKGLNIKEIPLLARGGEITQRGHAIVGEAGPELLELPQGAKVKPLDRVGEGIDYDRLEAIAYTSFFEAFVDAMKSLGKGEIRIDMDGRTLAREMIPRIIAENQRMGVATT